MKILGAQRGGIVGLSTTAKRENGLTMLAVVRHVDAMNAVRLGAAWTAA